MGFRFIILLLPRETKPNFLDQLRYVLVYIYFFERIYKIFNANLQCRLLKTYTSYTRKMEIYIPNFLRSTCRKFISLESFHLQK